MEAEGVKIEDRNDFFILKTSTENKVLKTENKVLPDVGRMGVVQELYFIKDNECCLVYLRPVAVL